jgi:hypothetical protein
VRCTLGVRPAEDTLESLEAVGRQAHFRPDDGRSGFQSRRSEDGDDRCEQACAIGSSIPAQVLQCAPHGVQPAVEKGGRLSGRTTGSIKTKQHVFPDAEGRPIRIYLTAGPVSDDTVLIALLGSLSTVEWLPAGRDYDVE